MADTPPPGLPSPTPEQRRVAAGQFERANEVLATGNHDYAIRLLVTCCQFDAAGLLDQAIWSLEQARPREPDNVKVNRGLARLYERSGDFKRATKFWQRVRKADPADAEAMQKVKDVAANETIARGGYEEAL